jgi:hypothetical protein
MSDNDEYLEYRKSVYENKAKSEDDFEKYITFISSGALGLSLTFIDKIVPVKGSVWLWSLASGLILLTITLLVNLLSHYLSKKYSEKTISDLDNNIEHKTLIKNIEKRNSRIETLNVFSIFSLFTGILLFVIYIILNIYNMNNSNDKQSPRTTPPPKPLTEEKGRTIPLPPQNKPSSTPKK